MDQSLTNILNEFEISFKKATFSSLNSGHINDTYLVNTDQQSYVLQKLNHLVFPNIPELMNNKLKVAHYLAQNKSFKLALLHFYPTTKDLHYFKDEKDLYWTLMNYIPDSKILEKTKNREQAFEAGKAFGHFMAQLDGFKAAELYEIIPDFHKMSFRYAQFDQALINAKEERKKEADIWIKQVLVSREKMHQLQQLHEQGEIPLRVTHNDTKLSNILFDMNNHALAVIDWDTLMPGIVHYDFGDSIRSICSTATEDETDLNKVQFNLDFYQAYYKGFTDELQGILSPLEIKLLPLAAQTITFIMGLRFLTDFLNGDVYYKIKYPKHNLDRAANQLTLVKRMKKLEEE